MNLVKTKYISIPLAVLFIFTLVSPAHAHNQGGAVWKLTLISLPVAIIFITAITGGYTIWKVENRKYKSASLRFDIIYFVISLFIASIASLHAGGLMLAVFGIVRGILLIFKSIKVKDLLTQANMNASHLRNGGAILLILAIFLTVGPLSTPVRYQSDFMQYNTSDAKHNLHNLHIACEAYWKETSPEKECTPQIASLPAYGFVQSSTVLVEGGGPKATFSARSFHKATSSWFKIDSSWKITGKPPDIAVYGFNWYENFLNFLGIYDHP
jgi:hypothetical protein